MSRRLYAESNFVLEVVLDQEDRDVCEDLLTQAEEGAVELVLPAFSLAEPLDTLGRRHKKRQRLQQGLLEELGQLRRSQKYRGDLTEAHNTIPALLARSRTEDANRLESLYVRVIESCELAPFSGPVVGAAFPLGQDFDLELADAIVLSSVLAHLDINPSTSAAFVTKNSKDFDDPELRELLNEAGCELLTSFGRARGFVEQDL